METDHKDKPQLNALAITLIAFSTFAQVASYVVYNGFSNHFILQSTYEVMQWNFVLFTSIHCILPIAFFLINNFSQKIPEDYHKYRPLFIVFYILLSIVLILPHDKLLYHIFLFPFILFTMFLIGPYVVMRKSNVVKSDDRGIGVNKKGDKDSPRLKVKGKGYLVIPKIDAALFCEGGPGTGKSAYKANPLIWELVARLSRAGVIYDLEGDPLEPGALPLTTTAYNAVLNQKPIKTNDFKTLPKLKFAMIQFTDPFTSIQTNPLSKKNCPTENELRSSIELLMITLNKEWLTKRDIWADSAIALVQFIGLRLRRIEDGKYCTLPHLLCCLYQPVETLLNFLKEDRDSEVWVRSLMDSYEMGSVKLLTSQLASAQIPASKLYFKELFYILSPESDEKDFLLDVSVKDNPYVLCVGNKFKIQEILAPPLSVILTTLARNLNQFDRRKAFFMIDELPTVFIQHLKSLAATIRKKGVAVILFIQSFKQLVIDYGRDEAEVIRSTCMNSFVLGTREDATPSYMSKLFGKYKNKKISVSNSESGESVSESLEDKDRVSVEEITTQPAGHSTGIIADGEPALFHDQLEMFDFKKNKRNVPPFNKTIDTGDIDMDRKIIDEIMEHRFREVMDEVKDLLVKYGKVEEINETSIEELAAE